jgi:hypothetical protein
MMPSTSKKQHNFMAAVAHSPSFAKKAGVSQSVGQEFTQADKGRKFAKGGDMKESKAMMKKEVGFMKKAGAPKSMVKHEEAEMKGMKKMASGGMPDALAKHAAKPASKAHAGLKAGGSVFRKGADGIAKKGKTKAAQVKMAGGGMYKSGGMC